MNNKVFFFPPLISFCVFLFFWHYSVIWFVIPPYVVPGPKQVFVTAFQNMGTLFTATLFTGLASLTGFVLSIVVGIFISLLFTVSRIIRQSLYPYAIFLQTVPIVAIAPLIVIWFGNGFSSVVIIVFIMSLFPIITNGTTGLIATKKDLVDLFLVNNASPLQILLMLRLPHSIPYIVTGAKISSGLSVIGAIVGEFFAGYATNQHGLGYLITLCAGQMKVDYLFATVFMSTLLGLFFFGTVSLIGNYILKNWK